MIRFHHALPIILAFSITGIPAASATPPSASIIVLAKSTITLDQAVNKIRNKTGGRILSAKKLNNAEPVYLIKVLMTTGQVKVFRVSAETGEIR